MVNSIRRTKAIKVQPFLPRRFEEANDVESNPGPISPKKDINSQNKKKSSRSFSVPRKMTDAQEDSLSSSTASTERDEDKLSRLESEIAILQETLENVDQNVRKLQDTVDSLRPIYNEAKLAMGSASAQLQKNNLVFYGVEPDPLEIDMMAEPDFCRDILETRIKGIIREHLKISRDISFTQVARINTTSTGSGPKPIIVSFVNWKDKENILRQAKLLKGQGISITEDISNKAYTPAVKDGQVKKKKTTYAESVSGDEKKFAESLSGDETNREEGGFASDYNSSSASGTD